MDNSEQRTQIYFNPMQREVMSIAAHTSVVVAGRGTGKGMLQAAWNLRNFQAMPRSTTAFVVPNSKRAKTNTLPSMFVHWESWGYKRDLHWCVGRKPPKHLDWPAPIYTPDSWDNVISFYNGAIGRIISQERKGTSNSISFDAIAIDEAKYINHQQLKEETLPANRGQVLEFGECPWHHGMLITSDMPVTKRGSWFLDYESHQDPQLIDTLQGVIAERAHVVERILREEEQAPPYLYKRLRQLEGYLKELRKHAVLYRTYSSLTNLEILGEEFIRQQKRDLPALVFQTSILCMPVEIMKDGFYSSMTHRHKYHATDHEALDRLGFPDIPLSTDSTLDADVDPNAPLCIAFDYNANINWCVVGQADYVHSRLRVVRSFFVKYERKLPELLEDFDNYYKKHKTKEVIFYYDNTARGSNYAINREDFEWFIHRTLSNKGWRVRKVYIGRALPHHEKHLLINRGFAGQGGLVPYFNIEGNEFLLVSIQTAGVYNGKKDKRGEKLAESEEDRLEARTDGSDAFDTLYIGCTKFPYRQGVAGVLSGTH